MGGDLLFQWLGKLFAVGAISFGVAKWIANQAVESFRLKLSRDHDRDIERLRSDLAGQMQMLDRAIAATSSGYLVAQERRLKAVELLWETVLRLRTFVSGAIFFYQIFLPEEYASAMQSKVTANAPKNLDEVLRPSVLDAELEKQRPFLGERLWVLFYVYRAFAGRMAVRVAQGFEHGKLPVWYAQENGRDDAVVAVISYVLSATEIETAKQKTLGGPQHVLELLEQKILVEADKRVSGQAAAEISVVEGQRLADALLAARNVTAVDKK